MRRLLLHTGAGKTGTTALQVYFQEHRGWLAEHGVCYPPGPPTQGNASIISGNGVWLSQYLQEGQHWDEFWAQLRGAPEGSDVLLSSELLAHGQPERLTELRNRVDAEGIELQAAYLVRNPDEWFLSAYQQLVKRHGCAMTFEEFCDWYPLEFPRTINKYDAILGDRFQVISYEAGKRNLVPYFIRTVLGIEDPPPSSEIASTNRSLTRIELETLLGANSLLAGTGLEDNAIGAKIGPISDQLVSCFPTIERSSRFSEPMPERAMERWRSDINAINERLDEGRLDFSVSKTSPPITENERALARTIAILIAGQVAPSQHSEAHELAREISILHGSAAELAREISVLRRSTSEAAREISGIRNSASWRLTAPLRRAAAAARRSGSRG